MSCGDCGKVSCPHRKRGMRPKPDRGKSAAIAARARILQKLKEKQGG